MAGSQRQRRSDRVTDPAFLDGLAEWSTAQVRTARDDCREEESRLSYNRRVVHGQLDIAKAELARRRGGTQADLLDALPGILADSATTTPRDPRAMTLYDPEEERGRRRDDARISDPQLGQLPQLADEEVEALIARLEALERDVSARRSVVLGHLDRLQDDLVERYRTGTADVNEVVADS